MEKKTFSYEQLTEKFLKFEAKYDLLNLKICDTFPWQIGRISLFLQIINFYIPGSVEATKESSFTRLKTAIRRGIINNLFYNPFLDYKQSDILIFESGRKYKSPDGYIDIYTYHLNNLLKKEGKSTEVYEVFFNENEQIMKSKNTKHLDFIRFSSFIKQKISKCNFAEEEEETIKLVNKAFIKEFGVKIDLKEVFRFEINRFKAEFSLYCKLFTRKKPKEIFVINSCDKPAMVYAAKRNNIIVNELQHGMNSDKDVILNFPYTKEDSLDYFPNRFYEWDNVKMFFAKLPLSDSNIVKFPNLNLQYLLEDFKTVLKEENTILVISQPYGAEEMQEYILRNLPNLGRYQILYKVHPVENMQKVDEFENRCKEYNNIRIIRNSESIYLLMKKAKYVLGIYSSSLFEAEVFDCKIILLNLPGVEMSFTLLKNCNNRIIEIYEKLQVYLID